MEWHGGQSNTGWSRQGAKRGGGDGAARRRGKAAGADTSCNGAMDDASVTAIPSFIHSFCAACGI
eukprot:364975-Chlamydomonas_euryale.AAC.1